MPEMNGQEFAIEMRRLKPQPPIIMLSGAADVPERALRSAQGFRAQSPFGKPLNCLRLPDRTRAKLDRPVKASG